jgi:hypothetical protein
MAIGHHKVLRLRLQIWVPEFVVVIVPGINFA